MVYRRGNTYYARVRTPDGRDIRRSAGENGTKADAKRIEAKLREELRKHGVAALDQESVKFEDVLFAWLEGDARGLKDYSGLCHRSKHVLRYVNGSILQAPAQAQALKKAYAKIGLKPATINRRLAIVRRVLNIAFEQGLITTPIGQRIKLLPERNERHVYLTPEQIEMLAEAASGGAGDAIRVLAYTGMRLGELFALKPENVRDGVIILTPDMTKSSKARAIPIPPVLEGVPLPPDVSKMTLRRRFNKAREEMGMPTLHLHDLRHTYASLLAGIGAPMTAIRDLLGHSNLSTTSRYAHLLGEHLKDVTKGLGK